MRGEEDAIHLLMYNRSKLLEQYKTMLATQRTQEEQIINLKHVEVALRAELQGLYQRLEEKEAESQNVQLLKPKLQARLRRFKDFLNGLHDDHMRLGNVGRKIIEDTQEARNELQQNKADVERTKATLSETQEAIRRERELWTNELSGGEHQRQLLQQTLHNLQGQLDQAQTVSSEEHARNEGLEQTIAQARLDHEQLMTTLASHHDEVSHLCFSISFFLLNLC